jgi:hypothetical protein
MLGGPVPIVDFDRALRAEAQVSLRARLALMEPLDRTLVDAYDELKQISDASIQGASQFWKRGLDITA